MCGKAPCDRQNCTRSREHLKDCEARLVMTWPAEKRATFYAEVLKKRGPEATAELKQRVGEAWKKSQQPSLL